MDRFIEFEQEVNIDELQRILSQNNPGIMILRHSKLTGTVKVRTNGNLNKRDIKRAFLPYKVKKIHDDFPINGVMK